MYKTAFDMAMDISSERDEALKKEAGFGDFVNKGVDFLTGGASAAIRNKVPGGADSSLLEDALTRAKLVGQGRDNVNTALKTVGLIGTTAFMGGLALKSIIDKINNDARRKNIIEDLSLNDPIISKIDKETLMEWYATIYRYAPTLSADKSTVKEVLRNFATFGKVDLQTLSTLAKTEETVGHQPGGNAFGAISKAFGI